MAKEDAGASVLTFLARADFIAAAACLADEGSGARADVAKYPSLAMACSAAANAAVEHFYSDEDGDGGAAGEAGSAVSSEGQGGEALAEMLRVLLRHGAAVDALDPLGRSAALLCVLLSE